MSVETPLAAEKEARQTQQLLDFMARLDELYALALASSPVDVAVLEATDVNGVLLYNFDKATREFITRARQLVIELKET